MGSPVLWGKLWKPRGCLLGLLGQVEGLHGTVLIVTAGMDRQKIAELKSVLAGPVVLLSVPWLLAHQGHVALSFCLDSEQKANLGMPGLTSEARASSAFIQ